MEATPKRFMKTLFLPLVFLCASAGNVLAESQYQKDFAQLLDQRDKALAGATAPINARFKEQAELLLQRATQNNDAAAVAEINTALSGETTPGVVRDLKRQINGTKWKSLPNAALHG